jgi:hypothetical protein
MEDPKKYEDIGVATVPRKEGGLVAIEQERSMAEVQGAIILAKKFPRNVVESIDRIKNSCQRVGLAEQALYSYSKGGTAITGPSIRLAEAIAQNWGNIQFGLRELEQNFGESTIEAFAWDVETNVKQIKTFRVKHERYTKKSGIIQLDDPREIYETIANNGARRLRACILGIVPGDITEIAVAECEQTLKAHADISPEALKKLTEAFAVFGVTTLQIEKRIQRRLDSITPAQLISLRKVYNSLKDGMSTARDWFEPEMTEEKPVDLKSRLKKRLEPKTEPEAPAPEAPKATEEELLP